MKIGVIGAGRLGICFALLAESAGHDVFVSDIQQSYVSKLNAKELYSNEPEVEDLLLRSKKLRASTNNQDVIKSSDVNSQRLQELLTEQKRSGNMDLYLRHVER